MMLLNPYGVDMGTNGLILQAQSRSEIYADKLLAFALRPNRIKNRDLWDMVWLHQNAVQPSFNLIPNKFKDRRLTQENFLNLFGERRNLLTEDKNLALEFKKEMHRFLPAEQIANTVDQDNLWSFIVYLMENLNTQLLKYI